MAVITGSFNSLVSGTISGVFQNTAGGVLSGVIGTPGPQGIPGPAGSTGSPGQGVAAGGTTGQALVKASGDDYDTTWTTITADDKLPLAGGAMDTGAEVTIIDGSGHDSELAGWGLGVELSADHTQGTTVEYNGLHVYGSDGASVNVNPTQITLSDNTDISATILNSGLQIVTGTVEGEKTVTVIGSTNISAINQSTGDYSVIETNQLSVWNSVGQSMRISVGSGISFPDETTQSTAFLGYASPAFTGNPTAPTPALGDNDTSIATTAFVQSAIVAGSAHAETLVATVRNNTGSTLAAFTVVYISGAVGNKAAVAKAQANSESTSSGTFAVTETAIANNADGNVVSAGVLSGVNTSAFTDGDKLYLSPTVAGGVTTTKPSAPNHLVYVGVVTRSHPSLGTVSVRIQNGYELNEIHDVAIASVADKDSLFYESSTSLWKNYTPANARTNLGLGTASTLASTAVAQTANNLSDLASASTARTNLGLGTMATQSSATYATVASPTFTGTPTLPTGTIATTQSPGNNTTALATTAFVTAAIPAVATVANSFAQNNTAPVTALTSLLASVTPAVFHPMPVSMSAAQAGTGATSAPSGSSILPMAISLQAPNASTTGYAAKGIIIGLPSLTNAASIDWSKPMAFSCRLYSTTLGTAKTDVKVRGVLGRDGNAFQVPGTLAAKGFGWEFNHATGVLSAIAHNGSSLTTTAVTFTAVNFRSYDIVCYYDGAGTVSIYVNGTLAGTATGGPTGVASATNIWAQWEIENTSTSSAANTNVAMYNPKVMTTF